MNIYFSGIGGVGIGPLARIAYDAGYSVVGSDAAESTIVDELREAGVVVNIGQDGTFLEACHSDAPIDWLVYTSALPEDHPELVFAREHGIKTSKRDEFLSHIINEKGLKLIAVAGTHGKTTTTGMLVWALKKLGVPVSYSIGTTISFGPSGAYDPESEFFVYECDEYDRNFLHYSPALSLITSFDYDHPDTYPTQAEYTDAFLTFVKTSAHTILWQNDAEAMTVSLNNSLWVLPASEQSQIKLAGEHNRRNANLVLKAIEYLNLASNNLSVEALESFPGTNRRFEKIGDNLYSDYGHHPVEIAATLSMAKEISDRVTLVYQPHQNQRQHLIKDQYSNQFENAETIFWLPTYLSREDPMQAILTPKDLIVNITNKNDIRFAELDDKLWSEISRERNEGKLVVCMGAGTIDSWVRKQLQK